MTATDLALLIMRVVLGLTFMAHGSQKLFGWFGGSGIKGTTNTMGKLGVAHPVALAWTSALSEFGGGLLVLLGLLTPLAAGLIVSVMLVAIVTVHGKNGFFNGNRGYEFNLNLIALAVALMLMGAGMISLDYQLGIALPLNQLPIWAIVIVVLVPFGGLITTELSKRANKAPQTGTGQLQPKP